MRFFGYLSFAVTAALLAVSPASHALEVTAGHRTMQMNQLSTAVDTRIGQLMELVNALTQEIQRMRVCSDEAWAYKPDHPYADANGCVKPIVKTESGSANISRSFGLDHSHNSSSIHLGTIDLATYIPGDFQTVSVNTSTEFDCNVGRIDLKKGIPSNASTTVKYDNVPDRHCWINVTYDGNRTLQVYLGKNDKGYPFNIHFSALYYTNTYVGLPD